MNEENRESQDQPQARGTMGRTYTGNQTPQNQTQSHDNTSRMNNQGNRDSKGYEHNTNTSTNRTKDQSQMDNTRTHQNNERNDSTEDNDTGTGAAGLKGKQQRKTSG